jgi:putative salt-induced outer membrane protein YdiY
MPFLRLLILASILLAVPIEAQVRTPAPGTNEMSIAFGLNSSHGNRDSISLTASFDWNENIGRIENDFDLNASISDSLGSEAGLSDEQSIDWTLRYSIGSAATRRWFVLSHTSAERQRYAGLEFRGIAGAGIGRHLVERVHLRLTLEGGVAMAWEKPDGGPGEQFAMPFAHGMMSWNISDGANLTQTMQIQLNGDDRGDLRVNTDTEISIRISERLSLRPSVKMNWDNRPIGNAKSLDVITHTSLAFDF